MRFTTFTPRGGEPRTGVLIDDDLVLDLDAALGETLDIPRTLLELVTAGNGLVEKIASAVESLDLDASTTYPINDVQIEAPLRPGKIIGVGLNYDEHVEESGRSLDTDKERPERPVLFSKPATAVVAHGQPIHHNGILTQQLDWECELAVVIGKPAKAVSADAALDHVFGYSIVNDISARDQRRSGQWFYSKGQDTYAPFGPVIVTADEIKDPQNLDLALWVNDEQMQSGNTGQMIFSVAELIADISSGMTLEPGDVIITGSPQGVGAAKNPPRFLRPGDVVTARVEKIGTLSNPVKDAK